MDHKTYSMGFTTGSLYSNESVQLAELYIRLGSWKSVRDLVMSENPLQLRTQSSVKRMYTEIAARLMTLTQPEIEYLIETSPLEQGYLLWVGVCRRYSFIADFAVEVLRERYITLKGDLSYEDFDIFFNAKLDWHPELEKTRPATRKKARQKLFKMLHETDLLSPENMIQPVIFSRELSALLMKTSLQAITLFPVFDTDIIEGNFKMILF